MLKTKVKNQHPGGHQDAKTEYFFFLQSKHGCGGLTSPGQLFFSKMGSFPQTKTKATPDIFKERFAKMTKKKVAKTPFPNVSLENAKSESDLVSIFLI